MTINQFNKNNINTFLPALSFENFEIIQDSSLGGYKLKLNWNNISNFTCFKIYKSLLPKSSSSKLYNISQKALEKITISKGIIAAKSDILYNRKIFSKINNKEIENYNFFLLATIPLKKNKKQYSYFDKNIFLGKGYSYILTAINNNLQETQLVPSINFTVEDVQHPQEPEDVFLNDSKNGIGITIKNTKDKRIFSFKIFRANKELQEDYKEIKTIPSENGISFFLDHNVIPGNEYSYKVFSVDYFGELSLLAKESSKGFNVFFMNDATIPYPEVSMSKDSDSIIFTCKKNHHNLIGVTIQRKDVWMNEQSFSFKEYSNNIWPNTVLFDIDGIAKFRDSFIQKDKIYQYRVNNVLKSSRIGSYWISPNFVFNELKDEINSISKKEENKFKLKNFKFEPINSKQNPVFVKCELDFTGSVDQFIISYDNKSIVIDSINRVFYLPFERNKKIIFSINFIKNNKSLLKLQNLTVNT